MRDCTSSYGGVLALEQIVQDAPDQATHAAQVLGAFIRRRVPQRPAEPAVSAEHPRLPDRPDEDVQAALTALTRPASRRHVHRDHPIDLRNRHLVGARFGRADLIGAWLESADLTGARLEGANLTLAEGLTVDQVVSARPDHTTRLPAEIAADPAVVARIAQLAAEREAH